MNCKTKKELKFQHLFMCFSICHHHVEFFAPLRVRAQLFQLPLRQACSITVAFARNGGFGIEQSERVGGVGQMQMLEQMMKQSCHPEHVNINSIFGVVICKNEKKKKNETKNQQKNGTVVHLVSHFEGANFPTPQ
jgi:hypothetical protein